MTLFPGLLLWSVDDIKIVQYSVLDITDIAKTKLSLIPLNYSAKIMQKPYITYIHNNAVEYYSCTYTAIFAFSIV